MQAWGGLEAPNRDFRVETRFDRRSPTDATAIECVSPTPKETPMEFVWFLLIGLAAGWLAGQLMKGGGFGVIGDIIVGVIGAMLGGFLFQKMGWSAGGGLFGALVVATVGAIVLLFLLRLVKKAQ
jgi:uncharacterized membrane protein YeaQ/YmgE (transglycosylase-associated protein family)